MEKKCDKVELVKKKGMLMCAKCLKYYDTCGFCNFGITYFTEDRHCLVCRRRMCIKCKDKKNNEYNKYFDIFIIFNGHEKTCTPFTIETVWRPNYINDTT